MIRLVGSTASGAMATVAAMDARTRGYKSGGGSRPHATRQTSTHRATSPAVEPTNTPLLVRRTSSFARSKSRTSSLNSFVMRKQQSRKSCPCAG
jgi:hypothetical protein